MLETAALAAGLSWTSGFRLYLAVFAAGVLGRTGWLHLPPGLQMLESWWVIGLAGVLAVLGYSVNESVVIFDRIREAFRKYRKMNTHEVIDHAITSTISRTIITHGSTEMMVLSMLVFGGPTLHYFALALTIGILFGIYSSVFVAAALCMWLGVKREDLIKGEKKATGPNDDPNFGAQV